MFRFLEINQLAERKKLLLAQSDLHRRTLLVQIDVFHNSVDTYKSRFAIFGGSSLAVGLGAILARTFAKKTASAVSGSGVGGGLFAKIASGISMFNQIKSIFNRFKAPPEDPI